MREADTNQYIGEPLLKVFKAIESGLFGYAEELSSLVDSVRHKNDFYLVCNDFYTYLQAQERVLAFQINQFLMR